ncbi:MAG: hypothetical protein ACT4P1_02940 [Sporichthyaceae bacterium]
MPATGGPVIAYAGGGFGASRLSALDADGRAVAWDDRPGTGDHVALCPGGSAVIATGRTTAVDYADQVPELTVHDATSLRVLRSVKLPVGDFGRVHAVRCGDADGSRVQILMEDYRDGTPGTGRLLVVEGDEVESVGLGAMSQGAALSDGFVAVVGAKPSSVALVAPDGVMTVLASIGDIGVGTAPLVVSRDERTIAVFGEGPGDNPLLTIDARTGERLGSWTTEQAYVTGLAWTASGRLLVRHEAEYRQSPVPLLVFDRNLGKPTIWPGVTGEWGGHLGAVGETALTFGGVALTATGQIGSSLVASDLRLAATEYLLPVSDRGFTAPATAPAPVPAGPVPASGNSPADGLAGALGLVADLTLATLLAPGVLRRMSRSRIT